MHKYSSQHFVATVNKNSSKECTPDEDWKNNLKYIIYFDVSAQ
jgi:hypothetical protein